MTNASRPWLCAVPLVAGALLVGVPGLFHPVLSGEGTAQLIKIGSTTGWRAIHWCIAFGYVLAVAGLAGIAGLHASSGGAAAARIGASLGIFGYAVSLMGVLFMLGAANALAGAYGQGAPRGTDAVFLYDMLHPFALAALRIGAFAVSLGIVAFGWAVKTGGILRLWLGWFGLVAGLVGAVVATFLSEHSPAIVTGIGLAAIWQLILGILLVTRSGHRTSG